MLQLYFIRHGQSANNVLEFQEDNDNYLFERFIDPDLTEIGEEQAQLAGESLAQPFTPVDFDPQNRFGFGLTHLYTSLMLRAIRTSLPIAEQTGLPLVALPEVHETGGLFDITTVDDEIVYVGQPGPGRSFFQSQFPQLILPDDLTEEGWYKGERESRDNYRARAKVVVDRLFAEHAGTDDRVGIVMHGGIFGYILSTIYQIKAERFWFNMNNCAISRLDFSDTERPTLMYTNKVDHLPNHLIT